MKSRNDSVFQTLGLAMVSTVVLIAAGCHSSSNPSTSSAPPPPVATTQPSPGQPEFDSPDDAVKALVAAAQAQDRNAMRKLFGAGADDLTTGDPVEDANDFKNFAAHAAEGTRVEQLTPNTAQLYIGNKDWPFPIPLAQANDGKWYFETAAGKTTILARRVGHNELEAIAVCHAYVDAQRAYASVDRNGDGVLQYAQRLSSRPGKHDGLYWPVAPGEADSPFGPLVAQASAEGYEAVKGAARSPFHGYLFRVLTRQGPDAPGGKYDYVINGRMIAGFALVAWPAKYGSSGVMTFIVNQYGQIYQKDLGPKTSEIASAIRTYNPDPSWTPVQ
jgi:hypothetical protein